MGQEPPCRDGHWVADERSRPSAAAGSVRPRCLLTILATLLLTVAVVACGGTAPEAPGDSSPRATEQGTAEQTRSPDAAAEGTQVRIAFVPAVTGLLLNVAEDQGYFEDRGLDVELTAANNISEIVPTLGRQYEIALGVATDLIRAGASGLDLVQISGNTVSTEERPFVKVIVRPDSGIEDVTDLSGRRVGSPTLSGPIHMATLYWAQQEGVDPSTIDGVQAPPPNLPDQLNAGEVDAVEALEPFASRLLAEGNESLGDPFASIGLPLATNFWIANGGWARDNPEVVQSFRDALDEALRYVEDNEQQAREVLQEFTGMPPQVAQNAPLPAFDLEIRVDDLERWIEVLESLGEFDGEVDPNELVLQQDG